MARDGAGIKRRKITYRLCSCRVRIQVGISEFDRISGIYRQGFGLEFKSANQHFSLVRFAT